MTDNTLAKNIEDRLNSILNKTGMYYRIFSREKSKESILKKLNEKKDVYSENGKKMQDYVGVRIIFYFQDDIESFLQILRRWDTYDPQNESNSQEELSKLEQEISAIDNKSLQKLLPLNDKIFMPERLNLVMKMDEHETYMLQTILDSQNDYNGKLIDNTFEIQLRTVLSESWHEVEHDLRYKTRKEDWWQNCQGESRMLNGIYAALISNESQLSGIVDDIAYKSYLTNEWDTMIRFHFRRRTSEVKLADSIKSYMDAHKEDFSKKILKCDRTILIEALYKINIKVDITTDLILFLINRIILQDQYILSMEPKPIKLILNKLDVLA